MFPDDALLAALPSRSLRELCLTRGISCDDLPAGKELHRWAAREISLTDQELMTLPHRLLQRMCAHFALPKALNPHHAVCLLRGRRWQPSFVAIDFETANTSPASACAVCCVKVTDGRVSGVFETLINPPPGPFLFTHIHGLTRRDVAQAPTWADIHTAVSDFCAGVDLWVAHNAGFDRRVFSGCNAHYGLSTCETEWLCTVSLARKVLGFSPANLPAVCQRLGLQLKHHDAASDAQACAQIMIHVLSALDAHASRTGQTFLEAARVVLPAQVQ